MGSRPNPLLVLVLCLAPATHMQDGTLPTPSIWAEPGPVIRRGQTVTIVCRGPPGADLFRLEKGGIQVFKDKRISSPHGSQRTEARFWIPAVREDTAGSYRCLYQTATHSPAWSARSESLELQVTGLSTEHVYILVGTSVAFGLCLLFLVLLLVHCQHQKKRGPPRRKGEELTPQERCSLAVDVTESTADVAAVDTAPEKNRGTHGPSPAAGDPQEVTYAQLDQRALTRRAAQDTSPPTPEPTGDSSMYAALTRR